MTDQHAHTALLQMARLARATQKPVPFAIPLDPYSTLAPQSAPPQAWCIIGGVIHPNLRITNAAYTTRDHAADVDDAIPTILWHVAPGAPQ